MKTTKHKWKSKSFKVQCYFDGQQALQNIVRYALIIKKKLSTTEKNLVILGFNPTGTGFDNKQNLTRTTDNVTKRLLISEIGHPEYSKLIFVNLTPIRGGTSNELAAYINQAIGENWQKLGEIFNQNLRQINKIMPDSYDLLLATGELKHGLGLALYQKTLAQLLENCDELKVCCSSDGSWINSKFDNKGTQKSGSFSRNPINLGYRFPIVSIEKKGVTGFNDNFKRV
ncbi:DUF1643 domain-containing protein [Periweissella beninensis]|uniref:DUF1643 domain-containing protein n=1 Tax=Periweissella beninensis TaxID=504936 RepID=UPI0021A714BE|nr:DUF1643 domain-containing protein [Periweissella beninensis]MCT4396239.1 DUF1643 domain-containing protein [Periweissella beninensis]